MLEFVQQKQLATPDDVFYVSTGRWYTHNCSDFEAPPFNQSMWALATHHKVRTHHNSKPDSCLHTPGGLGRHSCAALQPLMHPLCAIPAAADHQLFVSLTVL